MQTYFISNNSKKLIVVLCGWGMDEAPFLPLTTKETDFLFIYDYSNLDLKMDFNIDFSIYEKNYLVAFSYGVFIAGLVEDELPPFDYSVAVSGTRFPIDKKYGINPRIFDLTLESVSDVSLKKFNEKMFDLPEDYRKYYVNLPFRTAESAKIELSKIKEYAKSSKYYDFAFDKAIVPLNDKIFPTASQSAYWGNKAVSVESGHFCLYKFNSFYEIIKQ
ncbi:MAG: DUF452 family protein [Candidatus Gastranaerophilales bacterium]|nr:DUF452 family protein [Candidatus Gastranaerophilales bacterium]